MLVTERVVVRLPGDLGLDRSVRQTGDFADTRMSGPGQAFFVSGGSVGILPPDGLAFSPAQPIEMMPGPAVFREARRIVDRQVLRLIKMWLKAPVEERDGKRGGAPASVLALRRAADRCEKSGPAGSRLSQYT